MSTTETALAKLEELTPVKIFTEPGTIDPMLDAVETKAREEAAKLDISTEKNRKDLASLAYGIGKGKNRLNKLRLALISDQKAQLKKIDAEGSRIWTRLESLQAEVRKPLTDWEEAEKQRITGLEATIAEIEASGPYTKSNWQILSIEAMQDRLSEIENDPTNWQEFTRRAALATSTAANQIREAIATRQKYDAEQAELEALRKAEAERKEKERAEAYALMLVKQVEEKAERERKAEADKAETARLRLENEKRQAEERAAKAEADAKEAAAKAKRDAEQAAAKAEADRIAAAKKAEQEKQAAILAEQERVEREKREAANALAAREANARIRGRVHRDILKVLQGAGFDEVTGRSLIELIDKGQLPHVSIQY